MLIEMMKANPSFSSLPIEKREAYAKLADTFEDNELALYLDPIELTDKLGIGNRQLWQDFLNFDAVRQYISGQMANAAQVATRKTLQSLIKQGVGGDVQAIRQINEMSGVLNSGDKNKVIVLHQINRSKVVRNNNEETTNV